MINRNLLESKLAIEDTLISIDNSLKTLVTIAQTLQGGAPAATTTTTKAEKPTKADTKKEDAKKDEPKKEDAKPSGPAWGDIVAKFTELSKTDGGRDKVRKVIDAFEKDAKVPALEKLGKNAEILAAIEAELKPAPAASGGDDDLGLG